MTPFRPGELTYEQAAALNALWREVQLLKGIGVAAPLQIQQPTGGSPQISLGVAINPPWVYSITGNQGNAVHSGVRLTALSNVAISNLTPPANLSTIVNPLGTSLVNGTQVNVYSIPELLGYYWGTITGNVTSNATAGNEAFFGNVGRVGNFGNAGNASNLTLLSNGCFANIGTANWTFAYNIGGAGNSTLNLGQWVIGFKVGNLTVALPVAAANVTRHGWVDAGNQTFGGTKTFTSGTAWVANTSTSTQTTNILANRIIAMGGSDSFDTAPLIILPDAATEYLTSSILMTSTFIYMFKSGNVAWSIESDTGNRCRINAGNGLYVHASTGNTPIRIKTALGVEQGVDQDLVVQRGNGANCTLQIRGGWITNVT